jgi:IclR family transcriptional regulator, KDG regulon repressor
LQFQTTGVTFLPHQIQNGVPNAEHASILEWRGGSPTTQSHDATPAITAVVNILDALTESESNLSLSELSRRTGVPKSSMHRMLTGLLNTNLVNLEDGAYTLGPKVMRYQAAYVRKLDVVQVFARVAAGHVPILEETMQLARLEDGGEAVFIAKLDCQKMIRPAAYVGRRVQAHATAVGKVLLSSLTDDQLKKLYPNDALPVLTPTTISSRKALFKELEQIRRNGFATTLQESIANLCCVSAPIRDATGNTIAALSVCMATQNPEPPRREKAISHLRMAAREISVQLGWFEDVEDTLVLVQLDLKQ